MGIKYYNSIHYTGISLWMFLLEGCKVAFVFKNKNKKHIAYYFRELLIVKYSSKPHPLIIYLIMHFNEDLEVKLQFCIKVLEFKKSQHIGRIACFWYISFFFFHLSKAWNLCVKELGWKICSSGYPPPGAQDLWCCPGSRNLHRSSSGKHSEHGLPPALVVCSQI